jgi:hypothetical protein
MGGADIGFVLAFQKKSPPAAGGFEFPNDRSFSGTGAAGSYFAAALGANIAATAAAIDCGIGA